MNEGGPGLGYAAERLFRIAVPRVTITPPGPGIVVERDVPINTPDGVVLRANVFRPDLEGRYPVLMSAHPYGKDALPKRTPFGYLPLPTYRFVRQPDPVRVSAYTGWEGPDPSYWIPHGYAVVNLDLRGFGHSEGVATLFSDEEASDYACAIGWAAQQRWSTGKIGLNGVSYLAISQWKVAALRPPALAAICPWEGFTDVYRDVAYPGGVPEDGFIRFWSRMTEKGGRTRSSLRDEQVSHPDWDRSWQALTPTLESIEVPALICASFSDHGLHSRGSFEAFRRIASRHRYLFTHRGGKWSTYYSDQALALQKRFFDCFLKGEENGMREEASVRLEVRENGRTVRSVRQERAWPLPDTRWTELHLSSEGLVPQQVEATGRRQLTLPEEGASFSYQFPEDTELAGPMKLRLYVELENGSDAHLFVAIRKLVGDRLVPFEGSFGFGRDTVTKGWCRLAHRRTDPARSAPYRPFHPCDHADPLPPRDVAEVDIELLPSATFFRRGETLRLDIQGKWFWRRNALVGMFPGHYSPSPPCTLILHWGGAHRSHLLVPRTG